MLAEINLLPQKEPKSPLFLILMMVLVVFFIGASAFLGWKYMSLQEEKQVTKTAISDVKVEQATQQAKSVQSTDTEAVQQLYTAIQWVNQYPVKTVPIIDTLTKALPQRGFIREFAYTSELVVQVAIQFDESREAAYFLSRLKVDTPIVQDAKILSVDTFEVDEGDKEEEEQVEEEKVMPRYLALYQIEMNRNEIDKLVKEEE
ncbi:hypothetical protein [Metabacillus iocasae]|uniref:Type IV pilus assembly protein PilN n=1 Tax=Priestia iocasae TaxID=2291674 RepID=A0ABS2QS63_9BACI|nr:hypothetical protein [Metabacillus iocasae]MBM7701359.1 type IV pilus assembly protein PilN [Metabacillus iocasae]